LQRGRPDARLLRRDQFFSGRLRHDAARPAVVARVVDSRVVDGGVVDDVLRVDVGDVGALDIIDRGVVEEAPVVPPAALIP
jgi:hypothetical protein